jgi:hypothetical protein
VEGELGGRKIVGNVGGNPFFEGAMVPTTGPEGEVLFLLVLLPLLLLPLSRFLFFLSFFPFPPFSFLPFTFPTFSLVIVGLLATGEERG